MSCQRQMLGVRWYHFVSNASVINETGQDSLCSRIRSRHLAVFGHVCQLAEDVLVHVTLSLTVKARSGRQPAHWRRSHGRPRYSWTTQIELDDGHCDDLAWDMAGDRRTWTGATTHCRSSGSMSECHSRSLKVIRCYANRRGIYDFLLTRSSNLTSVFNRF